MDTKSEKPGIIGIDNSKEIVSKKYIINEVLRTLRSVFFIEYCFGIFRCRITDEGLLPTNNKMKFFTLMITSMFSVSFASVMRLPSVILRSGKLIEVMDEVPSIMTLAQYVLTTIRTTFHLSESNIRVYKSIADLDFKLHIDANQDFYKKSSRVVGISMLAIVIFHVLLGTADLLTETDNIPLGKILILPIYLEQHIELCLFCLMIWMLSTRLSVINNYIAVFIKEKETKVSIFLVKDKKIAKKKSKEFNLIGQATPDNMKIRDLAVAYDIIGETCSLLNDIYNFKIFMSLVATFVFIIITIWTSLFYYIRTWQIEQDYDSLATIIIWCTTAVVGVGLISLSCERLLVTRNETKVLVNKLIMDYDLPKSMRVQAKAFMELIEAWQLKIFIYDMFSVDISLMLKFISVSTTYLIVIIQITHFL